MKPVKPVKWLENPWSIGGFFLSCFHTPPVKPVKCVVSHIVGFGVISRLSHPPCEIKPMNIYTFTCYFTAFTGFTGRGVKRTGRGGLRPVRTCPYPKADQTTQQPPPPHGGTKKTPPRLGTLPVPEPWGQPLAAPGAPGPPQNRRSDLRFKTSKQAGRYPYTPQRSYGPLARHFSHTSGSVKTL